MTAMELRADLASTSQSRSMLYCLDDDEYAGKLIVSHDCDGGEGGDGARGSVISVTLAVVSLMVRSFRDLRDRN